jgi:hypothetical protein
MVVIVVAPLGQLHAHLMQCRKQGVVQLLVSQATVEAFDEPVLRRLAGCDVMPLNMCLIAPVQNGIAGEFRAVITDNHLWFSPLCDQLNEFTRYPLSRQRGIGHQCQAFASAIIDHREHAESKCGKSRHKPKAAFGIWCQTPQLITTCCSSLGVAGVSEVGLLE